MAADIRQLTFNSGGERRAAELYLHGDVERPPVVVTGHGLGACLAQNCASMTAPAGGAAVMERSAISD